MEMYLWIEYVETVANSVDIGRIFWVLRLAFRNHQYTMSAAGHVASSGENAFICEIKKKNRKIESDSLKLIKP